MTDETCECCGTVESQSAERTAEREIESGSAPADAESESTSERWIGDSPVTTATLPDGVRAAMEAFFGDASIETLEDWITELRERTGGSLDAEDLCHADGETAHWGELDGTRHHFQCFYDAVALAELAGKPVDIRTESPNGTVVEARATGEGDVTATPSTAVVSFGVATDAAPAGEPTLEDAYAAICPAVNAFPTRGAYERWAARTPTETVGMPLSAATNVATGLVK